MFKSDRYGYYNADVCLTWLPCDVIGMMIGTIYIISLVFNEYLTHIYILS